MNIADLAVGGMLMLSGTFALIHFRTRRDKITGLTYKQFVWCCIIMITGGVVTAFLQFFTDAGHL